jgi:hypothetical protein
MAAVCGRFGAIGPAQYWAMRADEEAALVDLIREENKAKERAAKAARRRGRR